MKNTTLRKLAGLAAIATLASCTMLPMGITASAVAEGTTISIKDATSETFNAYKLLNATDGGEGKFAYTLNDKYTAILQTATGKTTQTDILAYIAALDDAAMSDFADVVYKAILADATITPDYNTSDGSFDGVAQGYYLISQTALATDDTAGTMTTVIVDTKGNSDIEVEVKSALPEVQKKLKETNDSTGEVTGWQDGADYDIGDVVPFQLKGTLPNNYDAYTVYSYTFHDIMSAGLTLDQNSIVVYIDADADGAYDEGEEINGYSVVTGAEGQDCTFEITFDNLKTNANITADSVIVVEYEATLNSSAVLGSTGNPNEVYLEYSNNPYATSNTDTTSKTPNDKVIVYTYQLSVDKTDGTSALEGAGFTLYKFDSEADDYVAVGSEITGVTTFVWTGLDAGDYKLEETTVPSGYNKADDLEFTITASYDTDSETPAFGDLDGGDDVTGTASTGILVTEVVNNSGSELPSTGGIGTTLFYVVGGTMAVGAGVYLIAKKRMNNNEE